MKISQIVRLILPDIISLVRDRKYCSGTYPWDVTKYVVVPGDQGKEVYAVLKDGSTQILGWNRGSIKEKLESGYLREIIE
jgi:hypothetical protein